MKRRTVLLQLIIENVVTCFWNKFKCSIDQAKRSFYRAANCIFAKVGTSASEEVMVQLLKQKCLPILLHVLDVCNLDKRSMQSLDFTMNRLFMKLFKTSSVEIKN